MRLLHLDYDDLGHPWGGGQARRTYEINRRLATGRGWEITVVTGRYPGAAAREVAVPRGRLRYERLGGGPFPLGVLSFLALLPLAARRFAHDLLVEDFTTPIGPALAPRWTRRPAIGSAQFLFAGEMGRKYHLPLAQVEARALRCYRWLIALTQAGAQHLQARAPRAEIAVIPQGLDRAELAPPETIDGSGDHVLYLGRLDLDQKGLDVLLRAWSLLPAGERPPLVLAGEGRDRRRVEQLVAALELGATVRLAGRVGGEAKRRLLHGARLVCLPSRYETFGIAAIEALAAGKPLVATNVPGLAEAAARGALLVPRDDPAALAAAVSRVWHDRELRVQLGREGRAAVEPLTWDAIAAQQAAFYRRVVGA